MYYLYCCICYSFLSKFLNILLNFLFTRFKFHLDSLPLCKMIFVTKPKERHVIYNFDTGEKKYAVAALLLYATYRSRDKSKFKVSPEMWGQIQRFTQAAAKRKQRF